jgi:cell division septation protein DedD
VAQHTQDEGFHEIQLNGKQLVFLFMAATVVSVVIFLCGVLVGRGVKAQLVGSGDNTPATTIAETTPTPTQPPTPAPAPAAGSDPTTAPPPPPASDELSYYNRLEKQGTPPEQLKSGSAADRAGAHAAAARPVAPPPVKESAPAKAPAKELVAAKEPAPAKEPPPAKGPAPVKESAPAQSSAAAAATTASSEPAGQGFAVQIAALNVRSEADAIAKRLSSKGYAAYVLTPPSGTPSVFRVRVGKFSTRHEAETVAARLQKEEQFKPWVTR